MRIQASIKAPPAVGPSWDERWEGPDKGLILSWLIGIERARSDPALAAKALADELPVLGWKGGAARALKSPKVKAGSLYYLATWQGLRGEDLDIEQGLEVTKTCSRTGVTFLYTDDIKLLGQVDATEDE